MGHVVTCSLDHLIAENKIRLSDRQKVYLKHKRRIDWLISLLAMLFLMPVFLIIGAAIKIDSPKEKVIFKQERIGANGKSFMMYKFRSMKSSTPEKSTGELLNANQYITRVGRFLRKSSLDELPQFWNVLFGSMSIVGPRPLIKTEKKVHYLRNCYGIYQIRPGITGLAQINGRDNMGICDKVWWDRTYLREMSFSLDVRILLKTVQKVLRSEGITDDS